MSLTLPDPTAEIVQQQNAVDARPVEQRASGMRFAFLQGIRYAFSRPQAVAAPAFDAETFLREKSEQMKTAMRQRLLPNMLDIAATSRTPIQKEGGGSFMRRIVSPRELTRVTHELDELIMQVSRIHMTSDEMETLHKFILRMFDVEELPDDATIEAAIDTFLPTFVESVMTSRSVSIANHQNRNFQGVSQGIDSVAEEPVGKKSMTVGA